MTLNLKDSRRHRRGCRHYLLLLYRWIRDVIRELTQPTATISGSVVNPNAAPNNIIEGISVTATLQGASAPSLSTVTDEKGTFTFKNVPNGTYQITASISDADGSTLSASTTAVVLGSPVSVAALSLVRSRRKNPPSSGPAFNVSPGRCSSARHKALPPECGSSRPGPFRILNT